MEREKDPLIGFRGVQEGQNSKGGDRITLTLGGEKDKDKEALRTFIEVLQSHLEAPKGVKIDIHISDKEYEGRSFRSAFCFVRAVQDMPFGGFGKGPAKAAATAATKTAVADFVNKKQLKA